MLSRRLVSTTATTPSPLTPQSIVQVLDSFIIGQNEAKRSVAIAVRNRERRQAVADKVMRDEINPKNILMIGPTGSGKTEIARRLAKVQLLLLFFFSFSIY